MAVSEEQKTYAGWLAHASRAGLVVLAVTFLVYAFGLVPAHVPLEELPTLWTLPLEEYRARTGAPAGWGWIAMLPSGEYLSLVGITILALATVVCYVRLLVALLKAPDGRVQAAIAAAQIIVLCVAATGLIGGGH